MRQYIRDNAQTLGVLLGVLAVLGYLTYSFVAPGGMFSGLPNDLKTIEPEADAGYTTLDGMLVDLADFKGKPIIVNAWATWMPFSKDELILLTRISAEYGDRIAVIAMNRMETPLTIRSYLALYGIPESITFLLDPKDSFYRAVSGYAMPETVFYRKDGTILTHKRGVLTEAELRGYLEELLR